MAVQTPTYYAHEYANIIRLLSQQKGSRIRGSVMEQSHKGQQASPVDQVGAVEMQPVIGRFAPMGRVDAPADRRWVFPNPADLNQLLDNFDLVQMIIDPKSAYVENALAAAGRQVDRQIISNFFGTNYTGQEAGTSTAFLTGNKIASTFGASAACGLTVKKMREARRIFGSHNLDLKKEELFMVMSSTQHDNLLAEAQVISLDFNDKPVLVNGIIDQFMGFKFIFTELLPYNNTTVRQVMAYCKSGLHLGVWEDIQSDVSQRKDLQGLPWQVYFKMMVGASRLEEKKCIWVDCAE